MAVAFLLCLTMLDDDAPTDEGRSLLAPLRALRHRGLLTVASSAFFYNFAFFTVLAWTPFVLGWGPTSIGLLFFGWGVLVAVSSVAWAPRLARRLGESRAMLLALGSFAVLLMVDAVGSTAAVATVTVLCGASLGLLNTLYTGAAMAVSDAPRPGNDQAPFLVAGVLVAVGGCLLLLGRRQLGSLHVVPRLAPALANAD